MPSSIANCGAGLPAAKPGPGALPTARKTARSTTPRVRFRRFTTPGGIAPVMFRQLVTSPAGGVTHDFNNLLTVIAGYSGLLEEKLSSDDLLLDYAQQISRASEHAASLTRQLLTF